MHEATVAVRERRTLELRGKVRSIPLDTDMPARANPYSGERPEISEATSEARALNTKIDRHAGPWQQPTAGEHSCHALLKMQQPCRYVAG